MRIVFPLITLILGLVAGASGTALFLKQQPREEETGTERATQPDTKSTTKQHTQDTGAMMTVESRLIHKQYRALRSEDEWPQPERICSYLTSYVKTTGRSMRDGKEWRVDVYRISDRIGHYRPYLLIGLDPDGVGCFVEQTNGLDGLVSNSAGSVDGG